MSTVIKAGATALAVVGVLALAGCGGDDATTTASSTSSTEEPTASGGGGGESVPVSETEYAIDPQNPTVKAGTVSFDVSNDGQVVHNLEVEGPNGDQDLDQDLQPGDSGTLEVDLSEPGSYRWYCPIDSHADQGMEGEITVE